MGITLFSSDWSESMMLIEAAIMEGAMSQHDSIHDCMFPRHYCFDGYLYFSIVI